MKKKTVLHIYMPYVFIRKLEILAFLIFGDFLQGLYKQYILKCLMNICSIMNFFIDIEEILRKQFLSVIPINYFNMR